MSEAAALRLLASAVVVLTRLIVPVALVAWVALTTASSKLYLLALTIVAGSLLLSGALAGAGWHWVGLPLRWVWLACLLVAFWKIVSLWKATAWLPVGWTATLATVCLCIVAVGSLAHATSVAAAVIKARTYAGPPLQIAFPLRGGRFIVNHGGAVSKLNAHHAVKAQRYALDVGALGALRTRASGLYPQEPTRYKVYGADVIAPCVGLIAAVEDSHTDQPAGQMDSDNLAGNYIVMHCGGHTVLLAHLMHASVHVRVGDNVAAGARLARVGNTGNTSEPHLHIHAVRGLTTDLAAILADGEPVPLIVEGRLPIRHDVFVR